MFTNSSDNTRIDKINENLQLISRTDGLTFGTDAYLLAAFIKSRPSLRGAELGTGTGVISLLLASKKKMKKIYAAEVQEDFYHLTSENVAVNGLSDKITPIFKDVRDLSAADTEGEVGVVFSNPPYMKAESGLNSQSGSMNIARREICGGIGDFCAAASRLLKFGGTFYCVYRPDRLPDLICAMRGASLEPKKLQLVYPHVDAKPCLVLAEARKGGGAELNIPRPLIIYRGSRKDADKIYTDDFSKIYETCSFEHME